MVLTRLFRRRRRATHTDWFRSSGTPQREPQPSAEGTSGVAERNGHGESFVETLLEGDPALEATMRGVRGLRPEGRESIRRRYLTLADMRRATADDLMALSGIGTATARQLVAAARTVDVLFDHTKGLREEAMDALRRSYPSVGALAHAGPEDLTDLPGVGPAIANRLLAAARG